MNKFDNFIPIFALKSCTYIVYDTVFITKFKINVDDKNLY